MKESVIVLNWYGPYDSECLNENDETRVIYLATGRTKYQRNDQIQYCGITERRAAVRKKGHKKLCLITNNRKFWVAKIVHPRRATRSDLEAAASVIVYLWQPPLNVRKTAHPPRNKYIVVSHWFYTDGRPRQRKQKMLRELYDVMCWDGEFWRTSNLRRWSNWLD